MAALVTLPALLNLYKIDRDIHTLQQGLENVQREEKSVQGKIAALNKLIDTQDGALKKVQAEVGGKDLEMKTKQEHIEKMRASLGQTKTNKEYSAILVQISAEKAEVSKLETAILEQMQKVETDAKAVQTLRDQVSEQQKALEKIQSEQNQKVTELRDQIAALQSQRQTAAAAVKPDALQQYDKVSRKYPGDALAAIEFDEDDLDSVSCQSCYMGLSAEHVNALRGRDEIRKCNSCGRILYLPDMVGAAAVSK